MKNYEYNPYLALKTILAMTEGQKEESFIKIAGEQIKLMFKADLVLITKAINVNPVRKVKVLYSSNDDYEDIKLENTPSKLVFDNEIINISKGIQQNFSGMEDSSFESFYGIPISDESKNTCVGHIAIYSKEARILSSDFDDIALIYARKIQAESTKVVLENDNKKMILELQEIVIRDPLTNLFNRRYFLETCEDILSKVKRKDSIATLTYLDLDNFKNINDEFGHYAGDVVLGSFSKILLDNTRRGLDSVFRLEGEKCCIISIETKLDESLIQQNRILKTTENYFKNSIYSPVTVSIGIIEITAYFENVNHLIKLADEKMYEAKKSGINKIAS